MRKNFDQQLEQLNLALIQMGEDCAQAIAMAANALRDQNTVQARKTLELEEDIDHAEREIEGLCMKLLLKQQPVARDLRQISAAMKMIADMERIGDQAADIAEIVLGLANQKYIKSPEHISAMAKAVIDMVRLSVDAHVRKDLHLAKQAVASDDAVDELFSTIQRELIDLIAQKPENGEQALDFLMIAKYLERIGDHATNIAQWVAFSILGIHPEKIEVSPMVPSDR